MVRKTVEEVKEEIVEYIRDSGATNINQLYKELGCGKQTIYNAIDLLKKEDRIQIKESGNKKLVILKESIPTYLKYLTAFTALSFILYYLSGINPSVKLVVHLYNSNVSILPNPQMNTISYMFLFILLGYWMAVITVKADDVFESAVMLKNRLQSLILSIKNGNRRFY